MRKNERKLNYLLSLDLSSSNCGYAVFDIATKKLLLSGDAKKPSKKDLNNTYINDLLLNDNYLSNGVFSRDLIVEKLYKNIDNDFAKLSGDGEKLTGENTLLVIEKRLSGFSKFSTNKTIEAIAQLSQSALIEFSGRRKMITYHVPVTSWQNKLFGSKKERKDIDTKTLSIDYACRKYDIEAKSDDEADAICIGDYYLNNCVFNDLNNESIKEKFYKTLVKTLNEEFLIISIKYDEKNSKFKTCKEKTSINNFSKCEDKVVYNQCFCIDGKKNKEITLLSL